MLKIDKCVECPRNKSLYSLIDSIPDGDTICLLCQVTTGLVDSVVLLTNALVELRK